jgi:hypothetical protein
VLVQAVQVFVTQMGVGFAQSALVAHSRHEPPLHTPMGH